MSSQMTNAAIGLLRLQGSLVLMIAIGFILAKQGVITKEGRKVLSDLAFHILLPCSILKSYLGTSDWSIVRTCSALFVLATSLQLVCILLNRLLYNRYPVKQRRLMQYMTLSSNSGFLGAAIAQGLYGDIGLLYNSVFMIPMRIFMWTVGMSYFVDRTSKKDFVGKVILHPCLVALYFGLFLMLTPFSLPAMLEGTVASIAGCMVPIAMLLTGAILTDVNFRDFVDGPSLYYSTIRLAVLPFLAFVCCKFFPLDTTAGNIAVLMSGMPAATVTVLFATQYDNDTVFATKCVILTTMLSLITIPVWALLMMRGQF